MTQKKTNKKHKFDPWSKASRIVKRRKAEKARRREQRDSEEHVEEYGRMSELEAFKRGMTELDDEDW